MVIVSHGPFHKNQTMEYPSPCAHQLGVGRTRDLVNIPAFFLDGSPDPGPCLDDPEDCSQTWVVKPMFYVWDTTAKEKR